MKLKALAILFIILASLIPVYVFNKYLQQKIRPRASMGRLFLYMLSGFLLVFAYTFLVVFMIKKLFPNA
jgi:ATP/ADP translocase